MSLEGSQKPKIAEVVSIVAHQLKTPLSVIKGYVEVLLEGDIGKINKKQKEYLSDTFENIHRMAKIVNYLLDVSRIEERRYELKLAKTSLEEITQQVIKNLSSWVKASNCKIIFKKSLPIPKVFIDSLKVQQVIENLISNALKYKNPGQGKIEISLKKVGRNVLFFCKDNGIGIPKEDLKKIFTKFYRSEKAVEADPSGTGLGLYINKAIIELNDGKIWVKKNKGQGLTFYFTLPIVK